ncbi:hypothetical protein PHJA_000716600 [Phtheirospermum japonicum]|uniref:Uncharacterized protein n=1 Tax=Phtheirospermum japonicum TaxID=374723 RepID=A0A830BJX5_9LAMI|nr:hypothetical protein PHJA_000716600 [Phtheirospermum japonicum]
MYSQICPQKTTRRWKISRRRQRLPTVRLGGEKPRRGFSFSRACRKVKLKWMTVKYYCMLKKLKKYYASFVKDLMEGTRATESFRQGMILDATFGVPIMGPVIF